MTRGKNKKDEIDMRSSLLSIEFADEVPHTYQKSTLRVSLSEQRARDEVSRKRLTLQRLLLTRALEGFFFSRCWNLRFETSSFPVYAICFIEIAHDKRCLDKLALDKLKMEWNTVLLNTG